NKTFGQFFKELRICKGLSLRQFCLTHGFDSSNISKIERGVAKPPQADKLFEYAKCLGLEKDTDEWYEFCDLAAAEKGKFPKDLLSDEEIRERMPALFRAMRNKKGAKEIIGKIKDVIKDAWSE
ncbi:helix-turn-helix transcriptional regulator, partial [Candidatus Saganbacteria bacterium]|nr:helix-turn-helix transcriptional regulator [Candidatus Saganbacteria bacterium]